MNEMASPDVFNEALQFIRPALQADIWEFAREDDDFARMFKIYKKNPPVAASVMAGLREAFGLRPGTEHNKGVREFLLSFDDVKMCREMPGDDNVSPDILWPLMYQISVGYCNDGSYHECRMGGCSENADGLDASSRKLLLNRLRNHADFKFCANICLVKMIVSELSYAVQMGSPFLDICFQCEQFSSFGSYPGAFDNAIFILICELARVHPKVGSVLNELMVNDQVENIISTDQMLQGMIRRTRH